VGGGGGSIRECRGKGRRMKKSRGHGYDVKGGGEGGAKWRRQEGGLRRKGRATGEGRKRKTQRIRRGERKI